MENKEAKNFLIEIKDSFTELHLVIEKILKKEEEKLKKLLEEKEKIIEILKKQKEK